MRPPMHQLITLQVPNGEYDKYDRPILTDKHMSARVELTTKIVKQTDGTTKQATLEVDIMPDVPIKYGTKAKYTDDFGNVIEGSALSIDDSKSLSGKKTFFRTVFFG